MDEVNRSTPPDLRVAADNMREQRLPEKSKDDYIAAFNQFMAWHAMKKVPQDYVTMNVVMAYFMDLAEVYAPSTLASRLSMLKATIPLRIKNLGALNWEPLEKWVYTKRDKWNAKKSAVFTREQVEVFLRLPDEEILAKKMIFAFGVFGGLRKSELVNLKPGDVSLVDGKLEVKVTDAKTGDRWFMLTPSPDPALDVVAMYERYTKLRPSGAPDRLFLRFTNKRCTRQPIGKNMIASIPAFIAKLLSLPTPEMYTGHAMRRTGATILVDDGADFLTLKRFGAWRSDKVAQGYVANSKAQKNHVSELVQGNKEKKMKMTAYNPLPLQPVSLPGALPTAMPPPTVNSAPILNFNGSNNYIYVYMVPAGPQVLTAPAGAMAMPPTAAPALPEQPPSV